MSDARRCCRRRCSIALVSLALLALCLIGMPVREVHAVQLRHRHWGRSRQQPATPDATATAPAAIATPAPPSSTPVPTSVPDPNNPLPSVEPFITVPLHAFAKHVAYQRRIITPTPDPVETVRPSGVLPPVRRNTPYNHGIMPNNTDWNTYWMYLGHYRHQPMDPSISAQIKKGGYVLPPAHPASKPYQKRASAPAAKRKKEAPKKLEIAKENPKPRKKRIAKKPTSPNSPRKKTKAQWTSEVLKAKDPGQHVWGSLPESRPATSGRFKHWLKLVDLGYEGGEAERALSKEGGDPDRAALRLSREQSGFGGEHCLKSGFCFGDKRQVNFRTPNMIGVPEQPPMLQELPPLTDAQNAANLKKDEGKKSSGTDYSSQILKEQQKGQFQKSKKKKSSKKKSSKKQAEVRQRWSEPSSPVLNPYRPIFPTPIEESSKREEAPLRGSSLGTSEEKEQFTELMRSWFTALQSPFHTKKPDSTHESDVENPTLPSDTHQPIVPVKMQLHLNEKEGTRTVQVEWHQPVAYEVHTLQQLKHELGRKERLGKILEERSQTDFKAHGRETLVEHQKMISAPPKITTVHSKRVTPIDPNQPIDLGYPLAVETTPTPASALTPAQEQENELTAAQETATAAPAAAEEATQAEEAPAAE